MGHIFISYRPEDAGQAKLLQEMLETAGLTVWTELSVMPGTILKREIREAIKSASAFIPCFSGQRPAQPSDQYEELTQAVEQVRRRRPGEQWIFPVRFADCPIPKYEFGLSGYDLNSLKIIDLFDRPWEPGIAELGEALKAIGVSARPTAAGPGTAGPEQDPELSLDVQETMRPVLAEHFDASELPGRWTFSELDKLRLLKIARDPGRSRATDVLTALCLAARAKPVLHAVDKHGELGIGQLHVIYEREVGPRPDGTSWPDGSTADALLVEAADVTVEEQHRGAGRELDALARFVVGVAAVLGVSPRREAKLARWIESLGLTLADAAAYYAPRSKQQYWLHLDLGGEPGPWPVEVNWLLLSRGSDVPGKEPCTPTAVGLKRALSEILRQVQPAAPNLVVDLAVPRALMDEGIEHWPLIEVDGDLEPLSARHKPRLRWSQRRRSTELEYRHSERVLRTERFWGGSVTRWLCADPQRPIPCFITGTEATVYQDRLRLLLREGCSFVIWFPSGAARPVATKINRAVRMIKGPARRHALPEHLPKFDERKPTVIWDDPGGRGLLSLPPFVASGSL